MYLPYQNMNPFCIFSCSLIFSILRQNIFFMEKYYEYRIYDFSVKTFDCRQRKILSVFFFFFWSESATQCLELGIFIVYLLITHGHIAINYIISDSRWLSDIKLHMNVINVYETVYFNASNLLRIFMSQNVRIHSLNIKIVCRIFRGCYSPKKLYN